MKTSTVGAAVITGYVLGRFRKTKWALALAAVAGGRRLASGHQDGAAGIAGKLAESAGLGQLTGDLRGRLVEAGKAAAVTAASRKIDAVTGSLHERTASLRGEEPEAGPADTGEPDEAGDDSETGPERERRPRAERPERGGARRAAGDGSERRPPRSRGDGNESRGTRPARRRPAEPGARKRTASGRERGGSQ